MAARTLSLNPSQGQGLRPVDARHDLAHIAALMDLCFSDTLDQTGRSAVREMEVLSRSGPLLWMLGAVAPQWQLGFVWIEKGRLVGNISTQMLEHDRSTWLIANVAVHPEHRRRGIATALTEAAIQLAEQNGARRIQLQVHQHNAGAYTLYRSLGFYTLTTRTTWERASVIQPPLLSVPTLEIRPSQIKEWERLFTFVKIGRPAGFSWLRPLRRVDWKPSFWRSLTLFFAGAREERWLAVDTLTGNYAGIFFIESGFSLMDYIHVVIDPLWQGRLERPLFAAAVRRVARRPWATRVEHPAGDEPAEAALKEFGFRALQTLVWMQKDFS